MFSSSSTFVLTWLRSDSGIVNLYDQGCFEKTRPTPLKIIKNLTTNVTTTKFAPSNEILGIASRLESNAVKMVRLVSYIVQFQYCKPANIQSVMTRRSWLDWEKDCGVGEGEWEGWSVEGDSGGRDWSGEWDTLDWEGNIFNT